MIQAIAVYDEFRSQLAELKQHNSEQSFDYESKSGNKAARSHIYKLRQTKSAVEKARKAEKQASMDYGRQVDAQAKEITTEIEDMIAVHQAPLDEIEQREKERVEHHEQAIENIKGMAINDIEEANSGHLKERLELLDRIDVDDSWEEFKTTGLETQRDTRTALINLIAKREQQEQERAELERLRREREEKEQAERDAELQRQAEERARLAAEEKAKAEREAFERKAREEREAAERRELELRLAAEQAEREHREALERAQRAAQEAEAKAKREAEEAKRRELEEQRRREANIEHARKINVEAVKALTSNGIDLEVAKDVITLIAKHQIPHVQINY